MDGIVYVNYQLTFIILDIKVDISVVVNLMFFSMKHIRKIVVAVTNFEFITEIVSFILFYLNQSDLTQGIIINLMMKTFQNFNIFIDLKKFTIFINPLIKLIIILHIFKNL